MQRGSRQFAVGGPMIEQLEERLLFSYSGLLVSTAVAAPIELGHGLSLTTTVRNTGGNVWREATYAPWEVRVENASWNPQWSSLILYEYVDVNLGQTVAKVDFLSAMNLPTVAGTYSFQVSAAPVDQSAGTALFGNVTGNPKTVTFTILPSGNAPTDIVLSNSSVAENQPAPTVVGTLSSVDVDAGDTFAYSLVDGPGSGDNASFTITGNTLRAKESFDFEKKNSYSIRVRVTDSGCQVFEKAFSIAIVDMPELLGDATGDGVVNFSDYLVLEQHFNTVGGATVAEGDFNGDGNVNFGDYLVLEQNFGTSLGNTGHSQQAANLVAEQSNLVAPMASQALPEEGLISDPIAAADRPAPATVSPPATVATASYVAQETVTVARPIVQSAASEFAEYAGQDLSGTLDQWEQLWQGPLA